MQMNTPLSIKVHPLFAPIAGSLYEFTMMNSVDVASLVGDWRNVWEPKILDVDDKEESRKALQRKLAFEFY